MGKVYYGSDGSTKVEMKFRFKIDTARFAKRFGINIKTDDMDAVLTGDPNHNESEAADEAIAEDAATFSFSSNQVKTDLAHCKAQNPMTCRFHGVQAVANELDTFLQAQGVNGQVNVEITGVDTTGGRQVISVEASVVAPEGDSDKVQAALEAFYKLDGVEGDASMGVGYDDNSGKHSDMFEIDMLDAKAQARWKFGQNAASAEATEKKNDEQSKADDNGRQVNGTRPTRKRRPKSSAAIPSEAPSEPVRSVEAEPRQIVDDDFDPDAPTLFPGDAPDEPPAWNPPFSQQEIDSLKKMSDRLAKTVRQINRHIDNGTTAQWLQNLKHGNPLPGSLMKYKNEVDVNNLQAMAAKDPNGQVKKLLDVYNAIEASGANGWTDTVLPDKWDASAPFFLDNSKTGNVDFSDYGFDASKYADPYAKERAAFNAFKPSGASRKDDLSRLSEVDNSSEKDAPKKDAQDARDAAEEMAQLEDALSQLRKMKAGFSGSPNPYDDMITMCGQDYYKANERYRKAIEACKAWSAKQCYMKDTIAATIQGFKDRGETVPEELLGWQAVEDMVEDRAWKTIAKHFGFNVADKHKHMEIYKKNMRAIFRKCVCGTSYNISHVAAHLLNSHDHTLHANTNSYTDAANAAFGTKWSRHSTAANNGMHIYSKVFSKNFTSIPESSFYNNSSHDVGMVFNPKKAVISYVHQYGGSLWAVSGHPGGSNATFVNDATCSGVAANSGQGLKPELFTKDLSGLPASKIMTEAGIRPNDGEAWAVGGLRADQCVAIREFGDRGSGWGKTFSQQEVDGLNKLGITVFDRNGNIVGKDCVPNDPELEMLVWGKKGRPKSN